MPQTDAIAMLDEDHQRVEQLFADFQSASDPSQKQAIAQLICLELTVHAQLEEEIFYPAYQKATGDQDMVQEAEEEHQEAKDLIAKIEGNPQPDALVQELQQAIEHHVEEERSEMFAKARKAQLDLAGLAQQMETRKAALVKELQAA
ncbi:MAG TPA: hemerythrin domain-containing protein [Ramlibacter sp.]|nr:hemerythrin domain-containing protein [Ramlibacter sp.]